MTVVTDEEVSRQGVQNYYRGMQERAGEAIATLCENPQEYHRECQFGGLTMAVPSSYIPRIKEEIVAFQKHLLGMCDAVGEPPDRVVQFNLQLLPLSQQVTPMEED